MDLKDLSQLSQHLNDATDRLNTQLKAIEDRINALSLGVEAWVTKKPLEEEFSDEWTSQTRNPLLAAAAFGLAQRSRMATELGYTRFSAGWKLAVRTVTYQQTKTSSRLIDDWNEPLDAGSGVEIKRTPKPLLRASRTIRTHAVDRIPDLIEALFAAGTQVADAVEKARKISDSLK